MRADRLRVTEESEAGSVTAEFAMLLPAVAVILALAASVLQIGVGSVRVTDAAADAARMIARGDGPGSAARRVADAAADASMSVSSGANVICVTISAPMPIGFLREAFTVSGRGCAIDDVAAGAVWP